MFPVNSPRHSLCYSERQLADLRGHNINFLKLPSTVMDLKRVVVTGMGAVTPIGNDVETTWQNAVAGVSGCGPITHFDASKFKTQFACEVKNFDPSVHFDRKKARTLDLYAQYALVAAEQAVKDSGIEDDANLNKDRVGVIVAAGIGGLHTFEEEAGYYALNAENGPKYNPFFIPKMIADIASGHISMQYGYHGPNYGTVSACASSNNAIISAFDLIRLGKADAVVTGGAEAAIYPAGVGGFNAMHALSTRNDSPETASRPFSKSRDGFVMGEGSVVLVLEELEHAKARGARIYAEVVGYGCSSDAFHITSPAEDGSGAAAAMTNAVKDAGAALTDITYINAHGTATHHNDLFETRAIKLAFGSHAKDIKINSTKSMVGHLLGAAGAIEFITCVKELECGFIHKTVGLMESEEELDLNYCKESYQEDITYALSNSLGFGGHNASILLKKFA